MKDFSQEKLCDPKFVESLYKLFHKLVLQRNNEEEIISTGEMLLQAEFDQAKKAFVLNQLGICYSNQNNFKKAIECFQKTIELDPQNVEGYCNFGIFYSLQKDFDKAIKCFQKAIEIDPENEIAKILLINAI